ncbi:HSF-type DNA-binding-domain-containing protein [Flagelloscypha sp. PMI_526]|nr:HSF-type DNA-binding-domain-containing protein [Flagelloscypha sp. PMI_526]
MPQTSDFVKKLYRMLESPDYRHIVCWGPKGDCFIVKDTNEFTKRVLPKLFKHQNFASFVRQLNKYDFHKIKHSEDDNDDEEAWWTFKHPDFRANNKAAMESIKRKSQRTTQALMHHYGSPSGTEDQEELKAEVEELRNTVEDMKARMAELEARLSQTRPSSPEVGTSSAFLDETPGSTSYFDSKQTTFSPSEQFADPFLTATPTQPAPRRTPKVLLVDDDPLARKLSAKFLERYGCDMDVAIDGVDALNKINATKYDLVLMDIVMPKLDGLSATTIIRRFDKSTPIMAMTGNSRPDEIVAYCTSGMTDVLSKPFTRKGLYYMLEKYLAPPQNPEDATQQTINLPRTPNFDLGPSATDYMNATSMTTSSDGSSWSNLATSSSNGSASDFSGFGDLASVGFGFSSDMSSPLNLGNAVMGTPGTMQSSPSQPAATTLTEQVYEGMLLKAMCGQSDNSSPVIKDANAMPVDSVPLSRLKRKSCTQDFAEIDLEGKRRRLMGVA